MPKLAQFCLTVTYPSEAGDTIWLLLLALCGQYDPDRDYSAELKNVEKE